MWPSTMQAWPVQGTRLRTRVKRDWLEMIDTKLNGVWRGMKCQIPAMLEAGGGVNRQYGRQLGPDWISHLCRVLCFAAHGVMGLTKAAAMEYVSSGIRINAVCPGAVDAPILDRMTGGNDGDKKQFCPAVTRRPRLCSQEDIAEAVLWLASDAASYINGVGLVLDGGGSP